MPLERLTSLTLSDVTISAYDGELLKSALKERYKHGHRLKRLIMQRCRGIEEYEAERLGKYAGVEWAGLTPWPDPDSDASGDSDDEYWDVLEWFTAAG